MPPAKSADRSAHSVEAMLEDLIEKRVAIRTHELEERLWDAEQKLAQLKKLLGS
jgi:hypothetical protein